MKSNQILIVHRKFGVRLMAFQESSMKMFHARIAYNGPITVFTNFFIRITTS